MLYDVGFLIFSIFYLPTLIFRGKLHGDFHERFGVYSEAKRGLLAAAKDPVWIQAVSVGEVALCRSLIPLVKKEFPGRDIVLSTITRRGNEFAKKVFSNDAIILYFPLDFSVVVRKAVALIRPKLYIMIETEIWPNLLRELSLNAVPSVLLNGRISDRSFGQYRLVRPFLRTALARIRLFCMQSQTDADRITALGAPAERVRVTGTMKFDVEIAAGDDAVRRLKESLGLAGDAGLFVAGSTHPGEETAVVSAYKELVGEFPGLRLLIAPRHVERSADVENIVRRAGLAPVRLSSPGAVRGGGTGGARGAVYILDTIGSLNDAYSLATLVFMGGSLVPHGGQNPLEPASFGKPVIFGPHMFNFRTIASALLDKKGALQVRDGAELAGKARFLLRDAGAAAALGRNARQAIAENRGAADRNIKALKELL